VIVMDEELPEVIIFECPSCGEDTEHEILKGRFGKASVSGTFRCKECGEIYPATVRLPEEVKVKVLYSDGDVTNVTETVLMSNEIVEVGDEFFLDTGERVRITHIDSEDGRKSRKVLATKVKSLWVKQFGVLSVKVSVNDNHRTLSVRTEAEPDDEFAVGSVLSFEDFDCLVHAIKTKDRLIRKGSAEARNITRIYGKLRKKQYAVLEFDD
jgi:uncharacterized Zn finger protein